LFLAKLPPSEPKYLVVDAQTYSQLRQIPRFSEFHTAGDAGLRAIVEGTVGKLKDFYVFRSQFVAQDSQRPVTTHNVALRQGWHRSGAAPTAAALPARVRSPSMQNSAISA